MKTDSHKIKFSEKLFYIFSALLALALVFHPESAAHSAVQGIKICFSSVIPSIFPFLVLSSIFAFSGAANALAGGFSKIMTPLFRVSGVCAVPFVLGLMGGYPVGAETAAALYDSGQLAKCETGKVLSFCNNCGPAFILGAVGTGIFKSAKCGLILLISHVLSAVFVGFILRGKKAGPSDRSFAAPQLGNRPGAAAIFTRSVLSAVRSLAGICGFVIFFSVVIGMLDSFGVFREIGPAISEISGSKNLGEAVRALLCGAIEMVSGIHALPTDRITALVCASFILSFGGLSVLFQTLSVIGGRGLPVKRYVLSKFLQGLTASGLTFLLCKLAPSDILAAGAFRSSGEITGYYQLYPLFFIFILVFLAFASLLFLYLISKVHK